MQPQSLSRFGRAFLVVLGRCERDGRLWGDRVQSRGAFVIKWIVDDRETQVNQVQADLMGAAGMRSAFDEARSVGQSTADTKGGSGGLASSIDRSAAAGCRSLADRSKAFQGVLLRVANHASQVEFVDLIPAELLL